MASGQARKTVTALFCDLTGSTSLGEQLDPESLREVIERYFAEMRAVLERHGGRIEKFIGDAVMAVFGVPRVHEDDALRAVRAAADMQAALAVANERFEKEFGVRLQARIGVNTGEVIAVENADEGTFVSGDAVNTAARIEQAAEPGEVLLGEPTYRLVRSAVIAEAIEPITAKGKAEALTVYRLVLVDPGSEMLPRRLDAPLVGRWDELETLRAAVSDVRSGAHPRLITVVGEPGIGKSRLAHELVQIACDGARVLRGRCLPYGEGITFWPVAEILEAAAGIDRDDSTADARSKIAAILPPEHHGLVDRLANLLGAGGGGGSIQETFLAVRRVLEGLGAREPLVVVFDDIQWGEEAFLDLIQYLITFIGGVPVFFLCLARPELLDAHPDWSQTSEVIRLAPLDGAGSEDLVGNLLGGAAAAPEDVARTIVQAAGGNPLFIEEMLRMLVDQGVLTLRGAEWVVTGGLGELGRPETVHAVISARLDRLDPAEKAVLQTAAIIGEVFWWSAVADLIDDATPIEVARRLQALVRKDLIRPDPSTFFSEDAFRFGHLLIRDVAYGSLPKKARAQVHERFARWVEDRAAQRAAEFEEIIGYHAETAYAYLTELGRTDDHTKELAESAFAHLSSAGRRSLDAGDMPAAGGLLKRAVALLPREDPRRLAVLWMLETAFRDNGRLDDADEVLTDARDLARALGDRAAEVRAEERKAFLHLLRSAEMTHGAFLEVVDHAQEVFDELNDIWGLAATFRYRGVVHIWAGQCGSALEALEKALAFAARTEDRRLADEIRRWMCLALEQGPTPAHEALARIEALRSDDPSNSMFELMTHRFRAHFHFIMGNREEARLLLEAAQARYRELGLEVDLAGGVLREAAEEAFAEGELEDAERHARAAVDILTRIDDKGHLASLLPDLARVLLATPGREQEVLEILHRAEDVSIDDDVDAQVRLRAAKGRALFRLGREADGESFARDAVERAWKSDYYALRAMSLQALGEIHQLAGRDAEAAEAFTRALDVYEAKGDVISAASMRRMMDAITAS